MPIKQSAKKYVRVTDAKTEKNKKIVGIFRNALKKTREAVTGQNLEEAKEWLKKAIKGIDKAVAKKVLKKNTAARKKSRINATVKKAVLSEKK
ncbi:MAG: 30S ribosomal protein S20 [Candidatus Moraniibacteriota bacterium]|nr:MAG: 30S ribosomal protein S20 [Candidatus Moranbacteria bacterium]